MIKEAGIDAIAHKAAVGTQMMIELYDEWLAPLGIELEYIP
jgi:kynureninase